MSRPRGSKNETSSDASAKRPARVPLGVHHSKLSIPPNLIPKDRVGRWVNDVDNRVQLAINGGYEFVVSTEDAKVGDGHVDGNSDIGGKISKIVGSAKSGEPMRAYLMMIDRSFYEEDQATKQAKVDAIDATIRHPGSNAGQKGLNPGNSYGRVDYKA